ncbi:MAG: hypothetical protein QMD08_06250 [Actinomycetota bacterium]|nr:hypothetical protein [Actinomycetota bacterium]
MADGRWLMADGRWLMADGRWFMLSSERRERAICYQVSKANEPDAIERPRHQRGSEPSAIEAVRPGCQTGGWELVTISNESCMLN